MGGKSATTTSKVTVPPEVMARYNAVNARAEKVAETPYEKYGTQPSDFVAQMNEQQGAGIADINATAGSYQPYMTAATEATTAGMGPAYTGIDKYMSPYIKNVADTTSSLMRQSNEQAQSGALGTAASSGAFGGDRAGVAAANLNQQNQMAHGKTMADIMNQGYTQALGASQADLTRQMQGGAQMGALGAQSQQLGLQGAQAKIAAGTMQQQTEQAGKDAMIKQFMQEKGYPFQVAQYLANIAMGTGALSGSTTTSTQPLGIFGNLATGGRVGKEGGGGVAGPMSDSQADVWDEGYVPAGVLPVSELMVADAPTRGGGNNSDAIFQLGKIAMGGMASGGVAGGRHGYATDGAVGLATPEQIAEMQRKAEAERLAASGQTGGVAPAASVRPQPRPTGLQAPVDNESGRAVAQDAMTTLGVQPTGVVAPRPDAADPINFFNTRVIRQESGGKQLDRNGNPLTSPAGAVGVAQVMEGTGPEAAKLAGVDWDRNRWLYDADYNKQLGQAYFLDQYRKFGSLDKAAAAYNAGPGALSSAIDRATALGGSYLDYLPAETQNYVKSTTGLAGPSNTSISTSGGPAGLGGADMSTSGEPRGERGSIGSFFQDPSTGKLNPIAIKSILGGLAAMAKSNTISPISAILQGLGGGMETYNAAQKQAADIGFTNSQTANTAVQLLKNSVFYDQASGQSVIPLQGGGSQPFAEWLRNPAGPSMGGASADEIIRGMAANAARTGISLDTITPEEIMGGATSVPAPNQPPAPGMPAPSTAEPYQSQGTFAIGDAEKQYIAQQEAQASRGMTQTERELATQQTADTRAAADAGTAAASMSFRNNNELAATVARAAANNDMGPVGDWKARADRLIAQVGGQLGIQYDGQAGTADQILNKLSTLSADQMTPDQAAASLYLQNRSIFPSIDTDAAAAAEITAEMLTKNMSNYERGLYMNDLYRAQTGPVKSLTGADAMFNDRAGRIYQGEKTNIAELLKYAGNAEADPEVKSLVVDFFDSANRGGFRDEADAQAALEEIFSVLPGQHNVSSGLGRYFVQ